MVPTIISTLGQPQWFRTNQVALGRISVALPILIELGVFVATAAKEIKAGNWSFEKLKKIDPKKILIGAVAVAAVGALIYTGAAAAIGAALWTGASHVPGLALITSFANDLIKNPWKNPAILPAETTFNVFVGYFAIAAASVVQAARAARKGEYKRAFFHGMMGTIAVAAPIMMGLGIYDTRWHHLSYGLLCTLPGLRGLGMFGAAMSLESTMYWLPSNKSNFGFDNIFVQNMGGIVGSVALSTLVELSLNWLTKRKKKEEPLLPLPNQDRGCSKLQDDAMWKGFIDQEDQRC